MTATRLAWSVIPVHVAICGAALFLDGLFLFAGANDGIGTAVEVAVVAAVTTIAALAAGLPLRAIPSLRRWWLSNPAVTLIATGVAMTVVVLAWFVGDAGTHRFPSFDGQPAHDAYVFDGVISVVGWCLLAFTTAHVWWPTQRLTALAGIRRADPPTSARP